MSSPHESSDRCVHGRFFCVSCHSNAPRKRMGEQPTTELTATLVELAAVRQRESLLKEKLADCEKALSQAHTSYAEGQQVERSKWEAVVKRHYQRNGDLVELIRSIRLNADPKLFSPGQLAAIDHVLSPPKPPVDECYPRVYHVENKGVPDEQ